MDVTTNIRNYRSYWLIFIPDRLLAERMKEMGFRTYLDVENQGVIITTFNDPIHTNYNFKGNFNLIK